RPAGGALDRRPIPRPGPLGPLGRPPGPWLPRAAAAWHCHRGRGRRGLGSPGPAGRRLGGLAVAARRARFLGRRLPVLARADRGEAGGPRRAVRPARAALAGPAGAGRGFHAALAGRRAPPGRGRDGSQWTIGDQVAWGERDPGSVLAAAPGPLAGQLRSLLAALPPVRLPGHLVP